MLIPNSADFHFATFEEFVSGLSEVNWLDPDDKGTREEQQIVLELLWNFSVEQERREDELYGG